MATRRAKEKIEFKAASPSVAKRFRSRILANIVRCSNASRDMRAAQAAIRAIGTSPPIQAFASHRKEITAAYVKSRAAIRRIQDGQKHSIFDPPPPPGSPGRVPATTGTVLRVAGCTLPPYDWRYTWHISRAKDRTEAYSDTGLLDMDLDVVSVEPAAPESESSSVAGVGIQYYSQQGGTLVATVYASLTGQLSVGVAVFGRAYLHLQLESAAYSHQAGEAARADTDIYLSKVAWGLDTHAFDGQSFVSTVRVPYKPGIIYSVDGRLVAWVDVRGLADVRVNCRAKIERICCSLE